MENRIQFEILKKLREKMLELNVSPETDPVEMVVETMK
jgi:hypothetical protein